LAEALEVSDKAVSKWERGIACPDISLLPKLSVLLDTDIEGLFSGEVAVRGTKWNGILLLDHLAGVQVYSKPLVHFLLQNFLLVGIRDILIIGESVKELLGSGEQFGVQFRYSDSDLAGSLMQNQEFINTNTMIIFGNSLIFGANLTRKYQAMMFHAHEAVIMKTDFGQKLPIMFCPAEEWKSVRGRISCWKNVDDMTKSIRPVEKAFARGVLALPMNNKDEILTASRFVQIIEQCEDREFANLAEIAQSRGLRVRKLED
jgi:transcriptional regulator with XRE-family HTH domain